MVDQSSARIVRGPGRSTIHCPRSTLTARGRLANLQLAIALCCLASAALHAQSDQVLTQVLVTPPHSLAVGKLTRSDIEIQQGKHRTEQVTALVRETPPLEVGILLDESGSARHSALEPFLAASALAWTTAALRRCGGNAFLLAFNDQVIVSTGLTGDVSQLKQSLKQLRPIGGSAVWDALISAAEKFDSLSPIGRSAARVVVLITDGSDNASRADERECLKYLQMSGVRVYAVAFSSGAAPAGRKLLGDVPDQTGGRAFFPRGESEVDAVFTELDQDLSSSFLVGFAPQGKDGRMHPLRISLKNSPNVALRSQSGYFAPLEPR